MKRLLALVILIFALLSGCNVPEAINVPEGMQEDSTEQQSEVIHPNESVDSELAKTESSESPEPTKPVSSESESAIMKGRQLEEGSEDVWRLSNEFVEEMEYPELLIFEDKLLLTAHMADEEDEACSHVLKMLDITTGELIAEAEFPCSYNINVCLGENLIGICDSTKGVVRVYDGQLNLIEEHHFTSDEEDWYLSSDMKTLYMFKWSKGLWAVDLATQEKTELLTNSAELNVEGHFQDEIVFDYINLDTRKVAVCCLNLENGAISPFPVYMDLWSVAHSDESWLLKGYDDWSNGFDGLEKYILIASEMSTITVAYEERLTMLAPKSHLLAENINTQAMTMYDLDGKFISHYTIPEYMYRSSVPVWSDVWNGYFFINICEDGMGQLMFWEICQADSGEDLSLQAYEDDTEDRIPGGVSAAPELYERAKELSERFGVDIRIADQCQFDYGEYRSYEVNDQRILTETLDELEYAMSVYPKDFFRQLDYGWGHKIRIELVGSIMLAGESDRIWDTAAFVQECTDYSLMVIDASSFSILTFYHEFSHIIDNYLKWDSYIREDELFSEEAWLALQPEGFFYADSYSEMPDSVLEYADSGYFVGSYSCTFATEDRATMMEAATGNLDYTFEENPGMYDKLDYYSRCIRDSFDTSDWPEVTAWEQILLKHQNVE